MSTIMPAFQNFPNEGKLIGLLLAGYGELEIDLCLCVGMGLDDLDKAVKAMFRERGETRRINTAESMGAEVYRSVGMGPLFEETICGMRHCLKIRNQLSHSNYYDDNSGLLAFVNIEELAKLDEVVTDFRSLVPRHLTSELLERHDSYFRFIDRCFTFLNFEGRLKRGKLSYSHPHSLPEKVEKPPTHI